MIKRLVIPDSHGQFINKRAAEAAIAIARKVKPNEVVFLGDQLDASGLFSHFKRAYLADNYDFRKDVAMAKAFIADILTASGGENKVAVYMLEGNHEQHVERWIADTATSDTIDFLDSKLNPKELLGFGDGFGTYVKRSDLRKGMSVRGVLSLKGCYFMHGGYQSIHATYRHAITFGANICHGHTHRAASILLRRPTGEVFSGHCPGTLAEFAPLYQQTTPESWTHGIGLQFVDAQDNLNHYNVAINNGKYLLP